MGLRTTGRELTGACTPSTRLGRRAVVPLVLAGLLARPTAAAEPLPTSPSGALAPVPEEPAPVPPESGPPADRDGPDPPPGAEEERTSPPPPAPTPAPGVDPAPPPVDGPAVVTVLGDADEPLTVRIAAELEILGFTPQVLPPPAAPDPRDLEGLARAHRAVAAIWVDDSSSHLELWVVDRMTGKTLLRRISLAEEPRVVAVRAVELLRAGLLELERDPDPVAAEVEPPPAALRTLRPSAPKLGLYLGLAAAGARGGLGASMLARLQFRFTPHRVVGLSVIAAAPLVAARSSFPEGDVELRMGWVGVGPRFNLGAPTQTVQGSLELVVGPAFFGVEGAARVPNLSERALKVTSFAELRAAMEIAVAARVRVVVGGAAGACLPAIGILVLERRDASWCLPYGLGEGGIAFVW